MRLRSKHIENDNKLTHRYLGNSCKVFLFGSRLNDNARGGDVDLLVETPSPVTRLTKAHLKAALEQDLSLPVDLVVISKRQPLSAFQKCVRSQAMPLRQEELKHDNESI